MARMQFDKEQVLKNASDAFWRLGYNGTSMQTIVKETGLKPGSIYLAFGNKEGLFKEALDYYAQQSIDKLELILSQHNSLEEAIKYVLMTFIDESCQTKYCSCFLIKSQLELTDESPELQEYVSEQLRKIENVYFTHFLKNNNDGEAKAKATSIMLHIFGIRVYGYHHQSREQLVNALHFNLPWLLWTSVH